MYWSIHSTRKVPFKVITSVNIGVNKDALSENHFKDNSYDEYKIVA